MKTQKQDEPGQSDIHSSRKREDPKPRISAAKIKISASKTLKQESQSKGYTLDPKNAPNIERVISRRQQRHLPKERATHRENSVAKGRPHKRTPGH
jgi:hypothetical protein